MVSGGGIYDWLHLSRSARDGVLGIRRHLMNARLNIDAMSSPAGVARAVYDGFVARDHEVLVDETTRAVGADRLPCSTADWRNAVAKHPA